MSKETKRILRRASVDAVRSRDHVGGVVDGATAAVTSGETTLERDHEGPIRDLCRKASNNPARDITN